MLQDKMLKPIEFEHETDQYAFDYLRAHGINTIHLVNILYKITGDDKEEQRSAFTYLSTHPITAEQTRRFTEEATAQ